MLGSDRNGVRLATAFAAAGMLAALAAPGCTGSPGNARRGAGLRTDQAALAALVDPGKPATAAAEGFVGSARCIGCHGGTYESYQRTAHARGLRTAGRPGVTGKPVAAEDDFRDGLDLATLPAFAALGAGAPRLSFQKGAERPWRVSIGGVVYEIEQVYGGARREDYLATLGRSLYRLPLEYDVAAKAWVPVETDTWYLANAPRFASAAAAAAGVDRAAAAERRCVGCHASGFTASYDSGTGEWLAGYTELGTGCESCHGPGLEHVLSEGNPAFIVNPRSFVDGSESGSRRADDACSRCHTRGTGDTLPGSPQPLLYAWSNASGAFVPGDEARFWVTPSADPADYWGRKDNYLGITPTPGDPSDDSFVAARAGWNQGTEHALGAHAPRDLVGTDSHATGRCFDCHAVHGSGEPSMLREESPLVPDAKVSAKDGSLCLSCHAGMAGDPFEGLTKQDVLDYTRGREFNVRGFVTVHMADAGMLVDGEDFQPRRTGVGRCTTCHMPSTNTDPRGEATDRAGFTAGAAGGGSHEQYLVWPSASERHGMTNSCSSCHPTRAGDEAQEAIEEWATGDPDGDGRFHGYSPRNDFLGELNASSGEGLRCARCHTTDGFRESVVVGLENPGVDEAGLAAIVRKAVARDAGVTCAACHGRQGDGTLAAGDNPLRLPKATLCSSCHFGAGIDFDDYRLRGQAVHFPQKDLMDGTAGSEPPGSGPYLNASHMFFADACVKCHFDTGTPGVEPRHDFQPAAATCAACHPGATSFDIAGLGDYDGDGTIEGLQSETAGMLVVLKAAILSSDALVAFDGEGFRRSGQPGVPGATLALQRAAYNWETVNRDGSRGVHNIPRAIKLLQQSYKELKGVNVPGATMW